LNAIGYLGWKGWRVLGVDVSQAKSCIIQQVIIRDKGIEGIPLPLEVKPDVFQLNRPVLVFLALIPDLAYCGHPDSHV
jgi:hypothetical protein